MLKYILVFIYITCIFIILFMAYIPCLIYHFLVIVLVCPLCHYYKYFSLFSCVMLYPFSIHACQIDLITNSFFFHLYMAWGWNYPPHYVLYYFSLMYINIQFQFSALLFNYNINLSLS